MLGNPTIHDKEKKKFFKKTFGYFDKGLYNMMTNKFKKLYEVYRGLFESSQIKSIDTDDAPGMFSSLKSYMVGQRWKLVDWVGSYKSHNRYRCL